MFPDVIIAHEYHCRREPRKLDELAYSLHNPCYNLLHLVSLNYPICSPCHPTASIVPFPLICVSEHCGYQPRNCGSSCPRLVCRLWQAHLVRAVTRTLSQTWIPSNSLNEVFAAPSTSRRTVRRCFLPVIWIGWLFIFRTLSTNSCHTVFAASVAICVRLLYISHKSFSRCNHIEPVSTFVNLSNLP
jgi:hypothetical protein